MSAATRVIGVIGPTFTTSGDIASKTTFAWGWATMSRGDRTPIGQPIGSTTITHPITLSSIAFQAALTGVSGVTVTTSEVAIERMGTTSKCPAYDSPRA